MTTTETPPAPAACLCGHVKGSHEVNPFTGQRSGPCILRACGCGSYRPSPDETGRQQEARRTA